MSNDSQFILTDNLMGSKKINRSQFEYSPNEDDKLILYHNLEESSTKEEHYTEEHYTEEYNTEEYNTENHNEDRYDKDRYKTDRFETDEYNSDQYNNSILVRVILDIGEMLLMAGAEVSRVEDTMERIGRAYNFKRVDILTITSSMVLTVQIKEDEIITQTRRIKLMQVDMEKLEAINALSREICKDTLTIRDLQNRINDIKKVRKYSKYTNILAFSIISAAFAMFYGGCAFDAVASMLTGILLYFIINIGNKIHIQTIVLNILCSFVTGLFAVTLIGLGIGKSFDKIIIGNIMLLIPGIYLTTSLRDMIKGDLITGLLGLSEALLKAFAIAIGFAMVMILKGVY